MPSIIHRTDLNTIYDSQQQILIGIKLLYVLVAKIKSNMYLVKWMANRQIGKLYIAMGAGLMLMNHPQLGLIKKIPLQAPKILCI